MATILPQDNLVCGGKNDVKLASLVCSANMIELQLTYKDK